MMILLAFASLPARAQTPNVLVPPPPAPAQRTDLPHPVIDRIRAAQSVTCGVSKEEEDYSRAEDHGNRAAFDIDLCKAVAVAVLGPGSKLVVKSFPDEPAAITALKNGTVDLLATASPTVANAATGLVFTRPVFYDGQGFLTPNLATIHSPLDLAGKKVCFLTASLAEDGLHSFATQHGISYIWYPFSEAGEMEAAFFTGNCDAITSDMSQIANIHGIDPRRAKDFKVLPQLIRQDPLATATAGDDTRFAAIISWTIETLITAEQLGVTQANVRTVVSSTRPEVQELLGQRYGSGTLLGIDPHWGANVLEAVGNYGEIFDRDLGLHSKLGIDRGENRLWTDGGLMFGFQPNPR
ncbi:MAG: hypothetical protein ACRYFU_11190 [Janthinobacterium lividum]